MMAEAQLAFPGSVGRMVARRILESEGLEDACSSCDERMPIVREATAQYAARRTNVPPTDLQAYEQSAEETIESEEEDPLEPIPEGEKPEEEETEVSPDRWNPPPEGSEEGESPEVELQGSAELGGQSSTEHDAESWVCRCSTMPRSMKLWKPMWRRPRKMRILSKMGKE